MGTCPMVSFEFVPLATFDTNYEQVIPPGDHAPQYQSQGCFAFDSDQLGVQLVGRRDDTNSTGLDQVAPVSGACVLLRR